MIGSSVASIMLCLPLPKVSHFTLFGLAACHGFGCRARCCAKSRFLCCFSLQGLCVGVCLSIRFQIETFGSGDSLPSALAGPGLGGGSTPPAVTEDDVCECCAANRLYMDPVTATAPTRWAGAGKDFYCRAIHFLQCHCYSWKAGATARV
jgi:hypothetical protein